jgi:hypothetical protein
VEQRSVCAIPQSCANPGKPGEAARKHASYVGWGRRLAAYWHAPAIPKAIVEASCLRQKEMTTLHEITVVLAAAIALGSATFSIIAFARNAEAAAHRSDAFSRNNIESARFSSDRQDGEGR